MGSNGSSRRTVASASSYSAMGQYASSQAAAAEAARRRRIQEYKKYGTQVAKVKNAVTNVSKSFSKWTNSMSEILTGSSYKKMMAQTTNTAIYFGRTTDGLERCVAKAETNIGKEGEKCIFSRTTTPAITINKNQSSSVFYCDVDRLRNESLPALRSMKADLEKARADLEKVQTPAGCESTRGSLAEIDRLIGQVDSMYKSAETLLTNAEQAEAENKRVISRVLIPQFNSPITPIINAQTQASSMKILEQKYNINISGKTTQEVYDEATVRFLARENNIDINGKTDSEIIQEVAKKLGINTTVTTTVTTTKTTPNKFGNFALSNQLDFPNVAFGKSTVSYAGCCPTTFSMLVSGAINDPSYNPERLFKENADLNLGQYYSKETGGQDGLITNPELLDRYNLQYNGKYYWGEAFSGVGKYEQGRLVKDLKEGKAIIWRTDNSVGNNIFTGSGHYLLITGITDDGRILINDPNGANYASANEKLQEGLTNGKGFDIGVIAACGGDFYSYSTKGEQTTTVTKNVTQTKSDSELMNEINSEFRKQFSNTKPSFPSKNETSRPSTVSNSSQKANNTTIITDLRQTINKSILSNSSIRSNASKIGEGSYVNGYDSGNLPQKTLFDSNGINYFYQNGKYTKEMFSSESLKYSYDLKLLILELGYDPGYWVREDGVQMCGNDVMYAANIAHWNGENPTNSTYKRGDKWYGSSGSGRIVGLCKESEKAVEGKITDNLGTKVDVCYNTYTLWQDGGKYQDRYYSKDTQYSTSNIIKNSSTNPSERYYQTNESWEKFFKEYPQFRPEGTENITDWEKYFQKNSHVSEEQPTNNQHQGTLSNSSKKFNQTTLSNSSKKNNGTTIITSILSNSSTRLKKPQNLANLQDEIQFVNLSQTSTNRNMHDVPYRNQYGEYSDVPYMGKNLRDNGCGIYAASAIIEYLTGDSSVTPEYLARKYGDLNNRNENINYDSLMTVAVSAMNAEGVRTKKTFDFKEVEKALAEGKPVLALESRVFTNTPSGHFVSYLGYNEHGNVEVRDSNGYNWNKYPSDFANGFSTEKIQYAGSGYWICELDETAQNS